MNNQNNTGYGYMIVRVTTARGAIPLKGATVTISNNDPEFEKGRGDIIAVFTTTRRASPKDSPSQRHPESCQCHQATEKATKAITWALLKRDIINNFIREYRYSKE